MWICQVFNHIITIPNNYQISDMSYICIAYVQISLFILFCFFFFVQFYYPNFSLRALFQIIKCCRSKKHHTNFRFQLFFQRKFFIIQSIFFMKPYLSYQHRHKQKSSTQSTQINGQQWKNNS